jgi:bifunctional non-homologous end joining protein LigD
MVCCLVGRSLRMGDLNKLIECYPEVQLATLVEQPPDKWLHEIKLDGYRLLGFIAADAVCLRTRKGKDWTAKFPSLATHLQKLELTNAVLDMEAMLSPLTEKAFFNPFNRRLARAEIRIRLLRTFSTSSKSMAKT